MLLRPGEASAVSLGLLYSPLTLFPHHTPHLCDVACAEQGLKLRRGAISRQFSAILWRGNNSWFEYTVTNQQQKLQSIDTSTNEYRKVIVKPEEEADRLEVTVNSEHEETDNSVTVTPNTEASKLVSDTSLKPQEENDKKVMTESQGKWKFWTKVNSKIHEVSENIVIVKSKEKSRGCSRLET